MRSRIFADDALAGQVVLITGGGTGLGRATAAELLACGASVVVCGRRQEVLDGAGPATARRTRALGVGSSSLVSLGQALEGRLAVK
jgi:NAD(P)-dependent dehydrogenase (short-subunit alcohol dehydrogenase family)